MEKFESIGREIEFLFMETNKEPDIISRNSINYFRSGLNYEIFGYGFHLLHKELYKKLLLLSKERADVIYQVAGNLRKPNIQRACSYLSKYVEKLT